MPFDPTIPFKIDLPEPHRPLERYLTLRGMMDQRRVQESQMRRLEMQEQEGIEEQRELQGIRELFRRNPKPTPAEIYGVAPTKGPAVVKTLFEQDTQMRAALKAAEDLAKARAENEKHKRVSLKHKQFALLKEPDAMKRSTGWLNMAEEMMEHGYATPEEAMSPPPDLPTMEKMAERFFVATEGPEAWLKYQGDTATEREKRTQAALERSLKQIELAGHFAGTVRDQTSYDRWMSLLPDELKAGLDPTFSPEAMEKAQSAMLTAQQRAQQATQQASAAALDSPDKVIEWMNQPGRTPEESARGRQMLEQMVQYRMDTRPQFAQPGVDVPLPAAVEAQKTRMAQAGATDKPLSADAAKVKAIADTMIPEARALQAAIRAGGRSAIAGILTGSDTKLRRLAEQVADKVGRMRSGGAVNPAEEARFMAQISRVADLFQGTTAAEEAIESYINEASTVSSGMTPGGRQPAAPATPAPVVRWGKDAQGNPVRLP